MATDTLKKPTRFNRTDIEWTRYSWNPVTGCRHGCPYCYARDIATRFYPDGFTPALHVDRLDAPQFMQLPKQAEGNWRNVFTVSMGDLFGDWVPDSWVEAVLGAIRAADPGWNFVFLTKNPRRLPAVDFPRNCWVGTTVDGQARVEAAERYLPAVRAGVKLVSCEPLQEPVRFSERRTFDWLILGGRSRSTKRTALTPPAEWVHDLIGWARRQDVPVFCKNNLGPGPWPKEYPTGVDHAEL